jgi:RNase P subunit RPR2
MSGFRHTYCPKCRRDTAHDIYVNSSNRLHSKCIDCGDDSWSTADLREINGGGNKHCSNCQANTEHIRFTSESDSIHWFCCSCGHDVW